MQLPDYLRRAIEAECAGMAFAELRRAAVHLSEAYRGERGALTFSKDLAAAYAATRFPATHGALMRVFAELDALGVLDEIKSVLDAGAGPGAGALVASEWIEELASCTFIERERALVEVGERFVRGAPGLQGTETNWRVTDFRSLSRYPETDLAVCAYVLNELRPNEASQLARRLFAASRVGLVIVEPGTPGGFALLRRLRTELVDNGASIAAPCPHDNRCPMGEGDWCHFAARVERTGLHRRLKGGDLGYEDEKFGYLVATHAPVERPASRILRHPRKQQGMVSLTVCGREALADIRVTKKDKDRYKRARKADWGDPWTTF